MSAPRGPTWWVGDRPPAALDVHHAATPDAVPADAGVVVFNPCPPPSIVEAFLSRPDALVVVAVPCSDAWLTQRWTELGARCLCLEHSAPWGKWLRSAAACPPPLAQRLRQLGPRLSRLQFSVVDFDDAERLAELIARWLPDSERRVAGLLELLLNAIEHGNLGLTGEEKQRLLATGGWRAEVARRRGLAPWRDRVATLTFTQDDSGWTIELEDEGDGFSPRPEAPASPTALRGRGVLMAHAAFDSVTWEGRGQRVVARVVRP